MEHFNTDEISHESLSTLFSKAPVAMSLIMGDDFIIANANPQILELWGRDGSVIGKPLFEALPEIESQGFREIFDKVYRKGEVFNGDKWSVFLHKYGNYEEHFFNFIYAPVYNDQKEIIGVSVVATEVTDQVITQLKLKESEYRFEDLIRQSDYSIAIYRSEDLYIDLANDKMLETWGKDSSVIGMKLEEALPELEGQPFIGILKDIFKTGKTYTATEDKVDLMIKGKLQTFYYNFSYKPLKNSSGEVYAIYNTAVNVTQEVLARHLIQYSEKKYRELADAMPHFVWTSDKCGRITYMNENWYSYMQTSKDEDVNISIQKLIKPEVYSSLIQIWKESVESGQPFEVEYEFRDPTEPEKYRWFLGRAIPQKDEKGEIVQWIGTFTDIDDFKQLQMQKDNFLGIASHELKTPLTSLKLYSQFLETDLLKAGEMKQAAVAQKMHLQIEKLSDLINDLLDVTKIQNGQMQLNKSQFDFDELVEEIITEQQMTAIHQIVFNGEKIGEVYSDRHRLSQVMTNLISNAIKYSPEANQVEVMTSLDNAKVKFCVKDYGIGIPLDKQKKVFEQYYRVSGSKEHTFPGLGLGLYISSEIIKKTDGRIYVHSVEGQGSEFCFEIPKNLS